MISCRKCKKPIPDNSKFCNHCGISQIQKRGRRADGRVEKRITIDGKQKSFYGKTESEVLRKIAAYQIESEQAKQSRPFSIVADEWREKHFQNLSNGTQKCYAPAVKRAVDFFGNIPINQIKADMIDALICEVAKQGYSSKTVKTQKMVVGMIFKHGILMGDTTENIAQYITIPKNLPKKQRSAPSDSDIAKIKQSTDTQMGLFAFFLLYTGLRRGEALALRYEDIDFNRKRITINKSLSFINDKPIIKETKTAAGTREVILPDILIPLLQSRATGIIFDSNGKYMQESTFRRKWNKYQKEIGISCTAHQLRHAYATMLYDADIDAKDAQDLLGHTDIAITQGIYTHIGKTRKELTEQKLNEFVKKGSSAL
jgi:integrase